MGRRHGAVLVRTGDGGIWVGQLRSRADADRVGHKLPATTVLAEHLADVPDPWHLNRTAPLSLGAAPMPNGPQRLT